MKWAIALVCLSCADPAPQVVLSFDNVDACNALAPLVVADMVKIMGEGTVIAGVCVRVDEPEILDETEYPQR